MTIDYIWKYELSRKERSILNNDKYELIEHIGDCPNYEVQVGNNICDDNWRTIEESNKYIVQVNNYDGLARLIDRNGIRKANGTSEVMIEKKRRLEREFFLEKGDIVGVTRKIFEPFTVCYEHYGIYLGGDTILHYASEKDDFLGDRPKIHRTNIENFLRDSKKVFVVYFDKKNMPKKIWANTSLDFDSPMDVYHVEFMRNENIRVNSAEETIKRALQRENENKYDLVCNNCENMAFFAKISQSISSQVFKVDKRCGECITRASLNAAMNAFKTSNPAILTSYLFSKCLLKNDYIKNVENIFKAQGTNWQFV